MSKALKMRKTNNVDHQHPTNEDKEVALLHQSVQKVPLLVQIFRLFIVGPGFLIRARSSVVVYLITNIYVNYLAKLNQSRD